MEQAQLPFDVTAARHRGNPKSVAANLRIHEHKASDRERILAQIASQGYAGLTLGEIKLWDERRQEFKPINKYSGRLTELKISGQVLDSGRERDGMAVYVTRRDWVTPNV